MNPLITIEGPALSLPEADVDTDIIYPARFLLITEKRGLGRYAFHDRRSDPGFPLDEDATSAPPVLVAGPNFGCGSSREQAPWALYGLGIRVILAESFGEIFFSNCLKNGMLPIVLDADTVAGLHRAANRGDTFFVDLERCIVRVGDGPEIGFEVDPVRRESLLNGWNETTRIRALHGADIARYEASQRESAPWLWTQHKEETV